MLRRTQISSSGLKTERMVPDLETAYQRSQSFRSYLDSLQPNLVYPLLSAETAVLEH